MKIFIGIPTIREHKEFWDSMSAFLPALSKIHDVEVLEVRNREVDVARNLIVEIFMKSDKDYLLFLDDDHSDHCIEMVESLINSDASICAIKCYFRWFPFNSNLMDLADAEKSIADFIPKDLKSGYAPCDLVGFGMTIVKRQVFEKLPSPYFFAIDKIKEDVYFCQKAIFFGFQPVGCFDHVLTHNGINEANIEKRRQEATEDIISQIKEQAPDFDLKELIFVT